MAKDFLAIAPDKKEYYLSEMGIKNLRRLHAKQNVNGWLYGPKKQRDELRAQILTPAEVKSVAQENAELKARLAELEAKTTVPTETIAEPKKKGGK